MLCEIQGSLTPAQQLCEHAAQICRGELRELLEDCAAGVGAQEAPDIGRIMESSLIRHAQQLSVRCVCHLRELGSVLGRYDAQEQTLALQALIGRVEESIRQLQLGKADRCRSYEVLGVCAGCALAIILL